MSWSEVWAAHQEMEDAAPDFRILRHGFHRTQKDRLCDCGRVIPAGARYELTVGTQDGEFFTDVRCVGHDPNEPCPYPFAPDPFEDFREPSGE